MRHLLFLGIALSAIGCSMEAPPEFNSKSSNSEAVLTLTASTTSVTVGQSATLQARGGSGQITFSVPSGLGSVSAVGADATFTAPGSISGSAVSTTVLARDESGKIASVAIDILASATPSPSPTPAPTPVIQHGIATFTNTGSWTVPFGITSAKVTIVGGGGGGSGPDVDGNGNRINGRNGGAGVAFVSGLSAGMVIPITIGQAGMGLWSVEAEKARSNGGTSSFGSYVTASGGDGAYLRDIYPVSPYVIWGDGPNAGTFTATTSNSYAAPGLNAQLNKGLGSAVQRSSDASDGLPGIVIVEY